MSRIITVLLLTVFASAVYADDERYDQVSFQVSARSSVENDTMIAILYAEEQGSEASHQADIVNRKVNAALEQIRKIDGIDVQTESYTTTPVYNKSRIQGWRVRQSIRLSSQNMTVLSELLGPLQQSLSMQSLQFGVSSERRTEVDDELTIGALERFRQRATLIKESLGAREYRVVSIDISGNAVRPPRPYARAMMMESAVASPDVEAGEQTMNVTVRGTIELD